MAGSPRAACAIGLLAGAVLIEASACSVAPVEDDDGFEPEPVTQPVSTCFQGTAPSFELEVAPILESGCVQGSHCHSALNYLPSAENGCRSGVALVDVPIGGNGCPELSLVDRLLDVPATQCLKSVPLIVPCDPDRSYLIQKILGSDAMCDGDSMPQDGELAPGDLATLELWIRAGAPATGRPADACASVCD